MNIKEYLEKGILSYNEINRLMNQPELTYEFSGFWTKEDFKRITEGKFHTKEVMFNSTFKINGEQVYSIQNRVIVENVSEEYIDFYLNMLEGQISRITIDWFLRQLKK